VGLEAIGGGEGAGGGGLGEDFGAFEEELEGGDGFGIGDHRDAFDMLLDEAQGTRGDGGGAKGFGDGGDSGERDGVASGDSLGHGVGTDGFDAPDADFGVEGLGGDGDAADEAAAADADDEVSGGGEVFQNLEAGGALAGDDEGVVKGVDGDGALAFALGELGEGVGDGGRQDHLGAVVAGGAEVIGGRGGRHEDGGAEAEFAGGVGDSLGVVAAADGGDVAARGEPSGEELIEGAAGLERAGFLEELELEVDVGAKTAGERFAAGKRRAADAARDAFLGGADIFNRDGRQWKEFSRSPLTTMIDLRSDTVTKPTPAMRQAMANAEVGDDVYQEDPTVNLLERRAAEITGKEAALFVPTGTMGNTIAIKLHTQHGQEVICEARAHVLDWELAMMAWFAGCVARPIFAADGILRWERIREEVRGLGPHAAPTGLIEIENSHNMAGGTVYPLEIIQEIGHEAHRLGLAVHMDGARLFNAAVASGLAVAEMVAPVDTVMFCLSKGLGAPAGSMLAGTRAKMEQGRLLRKRLGGGMRQAGILAAAGLLALEEMPARLAEDHANARWLATQIAGLAGMGIDAAKVRTNIAIFDVSGTGWTAPAFSAALKARGVIMNALNARDIRLVTHYDVNRVDCEQAFAIVREVTDSTPVTVS